MAASDAFTEAEWATLQKGVTGSGILVSMSDRDLTDTFGEAGAMGKYLAGQHTAGPTELVRAIAGTRGTGFGMMSKPDEVRDETLAALRSSINVLSAKAPDEVEPYRALVVGLLGAVAEAKGGGTSPIEASAMGQVREALGV
jgi:hypothetical protein